MKVFITIFLCAWTFLLIALVAEKVGITSHPAYFSIGFVGGFLTYIITDAVDKSKS